MGLAYTNTRLSRRNSLAIPVAPSAASERKPKALDGGATLYRAPILAAGLPLRPVYRKINLSLQMCGDRGQASRIEPPPGEVGECLNRNEQYDDARGGRHCVPALDNIGQYVIPFPVVFRDDSWWNARTGQELDAFIAGWRPADNVE